MMANLKVRSKTNIELEKIIKSAQTELESRKMIDSQKSATEKEVIRRIDSIKNYIIGEGFNADDMISIKMLGQSQKMKSPVKAKYRDPNNHEVTWSGRGRTPLWAIPFKDEGRLDKILIK